MRHLLMSDHGLKIAAMVNDFAALNIDAALISDVSDDMTALANGCICCSLSGGIARGLAEIAARDEPVDAVLVEASGVSDPTGIAQVTCTMTGVSLDCIVTVVDAAETPQGGDWDALLARQIAPANLVVLNKADLVSTADLEALTARLIQLAPNAQILRTVNCAVPPVVIFESASAPAYAVEQGLPVPDHGFKTVVLTTTNAIDRKLFEDMLKQLPDGIVRIKGFLRFTDAPEAHILVQCVGRRWSLSAGLGQAMDTSLVVIGRSDVMSSPNILDHFTSFGLEPIALTN
jgi:G3E family GTPase